MGLTNQSIGMHTLDSDLVVVKKHPSDKVIALAGNCLLYTSPSPRDCS